MSLTSGSIAFVGFNADADDGFAFIAVDTIPAGTVIHFSDNEWNGQAIGAGGAFNTGEGGLTWTNGASDLPAGTLIEFARTSEVDFRTANLGTLSGGSVALGNSGEAIFAFLGDSVTQPDIFLAAVTNNNGGFSGATTSGLLAGTGLAAGATALVLPGSSGADVAVYAPSTGGSDFATREAALAAFNATANWIAQDGSGDQSADGVVPDAPFLTASPLAGVTFGIGSTATPTLVSLTVDAAEKPEGASFTFTATLSAAATADTVVTIVATGAGDALGSVPASITIPAGATSASFEAVSTDDTVAESDVAFTISATLGAETHEAAATIIDNDAPPVTVIGGITILEQAESLQGSVATPVATNTLNVTRIGGYLAGDGEGGAESIAFDAGSARAYVTNAALDRIDILDLSDPRSPAKLGSIDLPATLAGFDYGNVNSVAVRNGVVAVAVQNADGGENGVVALYDGATGSLIKTIEVGVLPDQLTFSPDGSLLLVANEAERFLDLSGEATVDNAPGTITIISVPANAADAVVRNTVGFGALDAFEAQLDALGIKTLDATTIEFESGALNGELAVPDSTVSQDIEPEYIAVSPDGTKAYVTLQEVNAVAVIDLTNGAADRPVSLLPLGSIDFSLPGNEADFSDRDGAGNTASISVGNAPVNGLLQPDAIASFEVNGTTYFITANEGDSRIVSSATLEDPALNEARASSVQSGASSDYARVNVDTVWSTAEELYTFGGRGFSIFQQNADGSIVKVEETGGDFEQIIAALPNAGTVFNGENGGGFDSRSDNKGAEPEGVAVGEINGVPYAFVALERIGGVMVWDLSNPADAKFVRYMPPTAQDYGPEVIKFVSAEESPNGRAMVLTANEISGSVTVYEVSDLTTISEIQGTAAASAKVGQVVNVEAVVVGDFQNGDADGGRNLGGLYLQEESYDQDGNLLSSEGIFVADGTLGVDVQIGDRVRVTGTVAETFGNTEIKATAVTVVEADAVADVNTLAVEIDLPANGVQGANGTYTADLEAYEGMLVKFPETLTITEQFNLDQFGEIRVTQGAAPNSYTMDHAPDVAGYDAHLRDIAARSIIFDDGRGTSNPNLDNTVVDGDYTSANAPRMGDQVTGLTGVLDYDFNQFRVHAVENGPDINDFVEVNERPAAPADVGGTLKVASFNVLNYFRTLDNGTLTDNGLEPRGAETTAEFERQTEKLVNVILGLDADVLGLMEIENNFKIDDDGNAIQYLVDKLNAASDTEYDWVRPGQDFVGGDAIAVGFIYDTSKVRVADGSSVSILNDAVVQDIAPDLLAQSTLGHIFDGANTSRNALAVTFEEIDTGGEFTAVVNHLKSKGGSGTGADADIKDGAGGWNLQRALAVEALKAWIEADPTGAGDEDFLILGDLNAYDREDAIQALVNAGYTDHGAGGYSYVFDGQKGSLDHILTNGSLSTQVTGVTDWHINADEADALDYQLNFNSDLTTNERDPSIFDPEVLARVSDHDPIVVGLDLTEDLIEEEVFTLQLLHLSDGEAGLLAGSTAKYLAAMLDAFDDDYANTLILSGGDTYLPGPFLAAGTDPSIIPTLNAVTGSTIAAGATVPIGAVDTAIHNALGVEVSAIGNHEWDLGSNAFAGSFTPAAGWVGANYAMVSANLDFSGDSVMNARYTDTLADGHVTELASSLKGRVAPAVVVEKGGERIGILGATTQILEAISSPTGTEVKGFPTGQGANGEVDDMALLASQLQPIIDQMRADGINKIILQAHLQDIANEKLLATLLKGVDIILSAGSNTRLGDADDDAVAFPGHGADFADTYPLVITDAEGGTTLIVNTDNEYTYLGRLKVDFDAEGKIIVGNLATDAGINGAYASTAENAAAAWNTTVDNLEGTAFAEGTKGDAVRDLTDAVGSVINVKDGNVFGFTNVYLEGERALVRSQETNLGNLSADANAHALRQAISAPAEAVIVSFKNGGGVRAQIGTLGAPEPDGSVDKLPPPANPEAGKPAGGISQLDIENSLRFDNKLMAFDTTAEGLKAILEHGVAAGALQGRFPQIGGVAFSWDPDLPAGGRVSDIALLDGNGEIAYALYDNGVLQPGAPAAITVVTLNFLANGGDGYPAKANGQNFRYLLADGSLSAPVDEALDFTAPAVIAANTPPGSTLLGEQQALGEYLQEFHGTPETAYDTADTSEAGDLRIQNLNVREDTVLVGMNDAPEIVENSLDPVLATDALGATLGADDLSGSDDGDAPLTYTVTTLPTGILLVRGEIATVGTHFTQADIDAGRVALLAGAVTPGAGGALADSFGFTLSDGSKSTDGVFTAAYEGYQTVQTEPRFGGYWGRSGDDYMLGTQSGNFVAGGSGHDALIGRGGNDNLDGGSGIDRLFGGDGNDMLTGGSGRDLLDGGAGRDALHGGGGDNILVGGSGDDTITADSGDDLVFGGDGRDIIHVNGGDNRVDAGAGDDWVTTGNGDDVVIAGAGDDIVFAGNGDNLFKLGGITGAISDGDDRFTGGRGADGYALFLDSRDGAAAGWGHDVITDFRLSQDDQLIAFNAVEGFWDDPAQLLALAQSDFVTGLRSADGGDLTLTFVGGSPEASSVTLEDFFWNNANQLSAAERKLAYGADINDQKLVAILLDVIQDGGDYGVQGEDFLTQASNLVSDHFML
ncbi:ExeM/NucH family extracellular endonuclease [Roseomonas hellenica]|uniref:ExeM/NucH family extracellular endonuclease n=1 Tax=Plastoroseomonas hellenica TaxID=2687306 RepID=A0ABS5F263_9PROT|nr:ExeM/NucH family extracellular endonuclease [Plastoroseomonas hellenica]MBR0666664.1 ExeM/NucH family extracellular endonuclease [Plastoroseomonas hellenica]